MAATAHTAQTRYVAPAEQMLSFQALSEQADAETESLEHALASILSSDLLRGQKAVAIRHNGSTYRLQATRLGKLILTK